MPQMAPLNWLTLMIFFLLMFLLILTLNYFSFQNKSSKAKSVLTSYKINWKW
uniref:ATP synthase complex subunit 8 n=1 Tax=Mordellidae sp. GENSP02 TaxID=1205566 RepID=A0A0S2MQL2_9CUCU|nr:ATP synthase F0 subunit 8 [Mordellidae sp. GENSP02]